MTNPFVLWLTGVLGWSEPGFVIMWLTVLGFLLFYWIVRFLIIDLPYWLLDQKNQSSGPARVIVSILLIIALVVAFALNVVVTIIAILGLIGLAGSFRDWWQKGGRK